MDILDCNTFVVDTYCYLHTRMYRVTPKDGSEPFYHVIWANDDEVDGLLYGKKGECEYLGDAYIYVTRTLSGRFLLPYSTGAGGASSVLSVVTNPFHIGTPERRP